MDHATAAAAAGPADETHARAARLAVLQLALALLSISSTAILFRLSPLAPTATAFYRTVLALPILALWLAIESRRGAAGRVSWRRDGVVLVLGGVLFAANLVNYAWAVHLTAIANASLFSNSTPIFTALIGFLAFRDRISRGLVTAMLAAIVGAVTLVADRLSFSGEHLLGDAAGLGSAVFFAAYLVLIGRLRLRLSSAAIMLWTGVFTALAVAVTAAATGESLAPPTLTGWIPLLALAIFTFTLGQGLLTVAMPHIGATFSAVALLSIPVTASLLAWGILGEALSLNQAVGGVVILGSILAAKLAAR